MPRTHIPLFQYEIHCEYNFTEGHRGDRSAPAGDSYPEPNEVEITWIDPDDKQLMSDEGIPQADLEEAIIRHETE